MRPCKKPKGEETNYKSLIGRLVSTHTISFSQAQSKFAPIPGDILDPSPMLDQQKNIIIRIMIEIELPSNGEQVRLRAQAKLLI